MSVRLTTNVSRTESVRLTSSISYQSSIICIKYSCRKVFYLKSADTNLASPEINMSKNLWGGIYLWKAVTGIDIRNSPIAASLLFSPTPILMSSMREVILLLQCKKSEILIFKCLCLSRHPLRRCSYIT